MIKAAHYLKSYSVASYLSLMYKKGMTTIISGSELLRRAVTYIDETMRDHKDISISSLIDEASMRYNLSPLDSEALLRIFSSSGKSGDGKNNS